MDIRNLDKGSQTPLYLQLTERLVHQIESGALKVGDKLPSERELADNLHVSRITARMAIENLMKKGLVYREQGKGTYVALSKMRGVKGFSSFTELALSRKLIPSSIVIHQELLQVDEAMRTVLRIAEDEEVIHIVRVRLIDDRPTALQTTYIPQKICPGLENQDLANNSLFALLRKEYFIHPAWTEAVVKARLANENEANLLNIDVGDPVLVVEGLTFTEAFEVVESVLTVYPADGFDLYIGRQRIE